MRHRMPLMAGLLGLFATAIADIRAQMPECNRKVKVSPVFCTEDKNCESKAQPCDNKTGSYEIRKYWTDCSLMGGSSTTHCVFENFVATDLCCEIYHCEIGLVGACKKGMFHNRSFMSASTQQAVGKDCTRPPG
jgi:hypothetical protein